MLSKVQIFYHPFNDSSFGFLLEDQAFPNNATGFVVNNINLYYQPVLNPVIAIVFFVLKVVFVIIGELISIKLLIKLKKETSLLSDVTKLFVCVQIIYHPIRLIFTTSTDFIHPLNEVIGQWYCTFGWCWISLGSGIMGMYSLICSLLRYVFILHETKVEEYGKEKVKKIFLFLYVFIPLLLFLWTAIDRPELSILSNINKCYGKHHEVFLIETSTLNVLKRNFWEFQSYELGGSFEKIIAILRRVSKIARLTIMLLISTNFLEGILYYKILSHMNRYNTYDLAIILIHFY